MPMLDDGRVREALSHPDQAVRDFVLSVLGDARSPDTSFLPAAIEAIGRYGRKEAFRYPYKMEHLAQTPETIRWAVGEAISPAPDAPDLYRRGVTGLLSEAEPTLVAPHLAALAGCRGFKEHAASLAGRVRHLEQDDAALWGELEGLSLRGKDIGYASEAGWGEMKDVVAALGTRGPAQAPRVLEALARTIADGLGDPHAWLRLAAARLAGLLRLAEAVPSLVGLLHSGADMDHEEGHDALVRIGTDAAAAALLPDYEKEGFSYRLWAASTWGDMRCETALRVCLEWLPREEDGGLDWWLANGASRKLAPEASEAVHAHFVKGGVSRDARDDFFAACTLLGQDFPELGGWREEARVEEEKSRRIREAWDLPARAASPPARPRPAPAPLFKPPAAEKPKAGRNDPCPCGSGKKYKKCCIDKGA